MLLKDLSVMPFQLLKDNQKQHRVYAGKWMSEIQFGKTTAQIDDKGQIEGFLTIKEDGRGYYSSYNPPCKRAFKAELWAPFF